jgi:hypothetical protein
MVSANGYHYTKRDGKQRLTHHILAEEILGRPIDTTSEMVRFKDGNRTNLKIENIEIIPKNKASLRKRLAVVEEHLRQYTAERDWLVEQIEGR